MTPDELEQSFPTLHGTRYQITSPAAASYNCIAWAAEDTVHWWEAVDPMKAGYYWPDGVARADTVAAYIAVFVAMGYRPGASRDKEQGFEKVAIYADEHGAQHVARQLDNGYWTSKLGEGVDIEHALEGLEGERYGQVVEILRRPTGAS
jgi:hypothetical protein